MDFKVLLLLVKACLRDSKDIYNVILGIAMLSEPNSMLLDVLTDNSEWHCK